METKITRWPHDEKIAVMVTIMFEVWSEGKAPPYSPMTTALKPGTPDLLGISWSQYGGKTGIWRFIKILDETEIQATVCLNAKGAEVFPEAVKALHARGHEIAGHSYTQDLILPYLSPEEERDVIQRCVRIVEKAVGTRPTGWFSPVAAPTVHTAEFLAEAGFQWHGDYNDTDLPYAFMTQKGALVAIPHSDFTDNRVLRGSRRDFYDVYKDTFRFPLPARETVSPEFNGSRSLRRAADDVGHAKATPSIYERLSGSLVRAP
jgi:hypothetical protein